MFTYLLMDSSLLLNIDFPTPDLEKVRIGETELQRYSDTLSIVKKIYEPAMKLIAEREAGLKIKFKIKNGNRTPVTNADKRIDKDISGILKSIRDIPILSEENLNEAFTISSEDWWLVDPLDGTSSFIGGYDGFASCISLIQKNQPTLGVIMFPAKKIVYFASKACGAYKLDLKTLELVKLDGRKQKNPEPTFATFFHKAKETEMYQPHFLKTHGIKKESVKKVSAALKYCLVAEGEFTYGGGFAPIKIWDVSAADIIASEAFCKMLDMDDNPLEYWPESHGVPSAIVSPRFELY